MLKLALRQSKAAEAGPDRLRLATIIQHASDWSSLIDKQPDEQTGRKLAQLARNRDKALSATNGTYYASSMNSDIKLSAQTHGRTRMPVRLRAWESSLLDSLRKKLDHYTALNKLRKHCNCLEGDGWAASRS